MAREVRITIDDDELFERMKRRKQALDLSWEEVLHRGLRPPETDRRDRGRGYEPSDPREEVAAAKQDLKNAVEDIKRFRRDISRDREERPGSPSFDPFDPASIEEFVTETVRRSTGWLDDTDWDEEIERVTEAEDAALIFPFLGSVAKDPANQVPLRVQLRVTGEGLDIEVVTVRSGKGVSGMNEFDRGVRQHLIKGLAKEGSAVLQLEAGVEEYPVVPTLTWSRNDRGMPVVDHVSIEEVVLDED